MASNSKRVFPLHWILVCSSCIVSFGIISFFGCLAVLSGETIPWKAVDDGFLVAEIESKLKTEDISFSITAIKIDPGNYSLKLLCATESDKEKHTAREWSEKYNLLLAVNAGMFQEDGFTSVGYMKNFRHVNNSRLSKANSILAFNAFDGKVPEIQLIDRECQDFDELRQKYQSFVQSIRMISCDRKNVWAQQGAKWSTLAVGMDTDGNILFLFSKTPQSVHDFIEVLLSLPLSLKTTMYLEGGPQASLYLSTPKMTLERNGIREGLEESGPFQFSLPIPNVLGVVKKAQVKS